MGKAYVSEFTNFMNQYLEAHPEVVAEQRSGWESFWKRKAELRAPEKTRDDLAPDDSYGYAWSAWRVKAQGEKKS
ncbi:MAG: DUF3460 family protein [Gallionella sp.]